MGPVVKVALRFRERFWEHDRLPLATKSMDPLLIPTLVRVIAPVTGTTPSGYQV
jgi:hypothetical protein